MSPEPEPPGDIRVQLEAVLDADHPKLACFLVPEDAKSLGPPPSGSGLIVVQRAEGVLVTTSASLAEMFRQAADDATMAQILGYPESKDLVAQRCPRPAAQHARCVQARTRSGHVVTEACCSGVGLLPTVIELQRHVPPGGELVITSPVAAIARRVALRWIGY